MDTLLLKPNAEGDGDVTALADIERAVCEARSTQRKGRVVTFDRRAKTAAPAINRPLIKTCKSRCARCGCLRCPRTKRR